MLKENQDKWVAALRSGGYKQGRSKLKTESGNTYYYCCLGVACEMAGLESTVQGRTMNQTRLHAYEGFSNLPPASMAEFFGMIISPFESLTELAPKLDMPDLYGWDDDLIPNELASLNDDVGLTFNQIADMIEYFGIKE